jgi:hypothetical protein
VRPDLRREKTTHSRIPHPEGWGTFRSDLQSVRPHSRIPHPEGWGLSDSTYTAEAALSESPTRKGGVLSDSTYRADDPPAIAKIYSHSMPTRSA